MRGVFRILLGVVLFVAVAALVLGYWAGARWHPANPPRTDTVGTTGVIDTEKARERGAELGEKAAVATAKVGNAMNEGSLTLKIKAKMALDDLVKARAIDVDTSGTTVTVSGKVGSTAERDRALALARETEGVERVVDHLTIVR